jgi:FecR-like protein
MFINLRAIRVLVLGTCLLGSAERVGAGALREPRLTQVVRDVQFTGAAPVLPSVNAILPDGSLQTGEKSGAEITFLDHTVTRIGDKTAFGFNTTNRTLELTSGAILTQVPRGVGSTLIKTANVTAAATGTTILIEHYPNGYLKFILLDGSSRLCLKTPGHLNDCVLLRAGQMLIASPTAKGLPDAVDVDLERLLETCHLITDFPSLPRQDLLMNAAARQRKRKSHGAFADTNLVIFGRGTVVSSTGQDGSEKVPSTATSPSPASSPGSKPNPAP